MSDLKKIELTVKNYNVKNSADIDTLYSQVRCQDSEGKTIYFKEVCMLDYLKRHGAIVADEPLTWYYKHLNKKSIVLVAFQKADGKVEYYLDHLRHVAKSSILKGIVFAVAAIPAGLIIATATFGIGLLFTPVCLFYAYRSLFKIPRMLRRSTLVSELAAYGVIVQ
ncbi:hypothetical protein [Pseudomonas sp. A214]|uniref:hypothetical protein n=1 Tax=Pseudomonas sp. A214 TaxID=1855331 RepID=UPI0009538F27|nr:hypothetical protein [Pseudomonas sp. A214]SIS01673.1 hypothetical protein SAMN05216504_3595 [Pseudomonas sp. A214]